MHAKFDFLSDGGEMGALMRARDWAATPLGPAQCWPETLKTILRLMLTSKHPMLIWWGPDLIQFYNDGYRQTMGPERHPNSLGQPGRVCWAEVWHIIGPQIEYVLAGHGATWHEEQLIPVTRHGSREDVWWTYGYSPIESSDGVQGVLVVCNDVTVEHSTREELVRLNQQLLKQIVRRDDAVQHHEFELILADRLRGLVGLDQIARTAFALLGPYLQLSRIYYGAVDETRATYHLALEWKRDDLPSVLGARGKLDDFGPAINATLRSGLVFAVGDTSLDPRTTPYATAYASLNARAAMVAPIVKDGRLLAALTVHRNTPFDWPSDQIALVQDVAQRIWNAVQRAEHALALQRVAESDRLRSLFAQAPGFMCILSGPNHVYEYFNAAYLLLVGERPLLGKSVREAVPELAGQGFYEQLDQVFSSATAYLATDMFVLLARKAGGPPMPAYLDFVFQPIVDANGIVTGIFVEGFDSTERRLGKLALQDSEDRLKGGMLVARMVAWDWSLDSGDVHFSDNTGAVLGGSWTSMAAMWAAIDADDLQRLQRASEAAIAQRGSYQEDVRFIRPDSGELLWLNFHGKVLSNNNGDAYCVRGVAIDITKRKLAEEALRDADRRKNEFLAMLSHELRNPLAPISAAAQLLSLVPQADKRVVRASEIIVRQVAHMTSLIDDLLDVSRVTSGLVVLDTEAVDLTHVVLDSIEQVRPLIDSKRHHFTFKAPFNTAVVMGDRKRLVQVVTNVLQNAAKYTPVGGDINLAIEQRDDEVAISVLDNGIGIDSHLLPNVFNLFSQAKRSSDRSQGGLGLGLALVRRLVELHGGHVDAFSDGAGKGATVTLVLPRYVESAQEQARLHGATGHMLSKPLNLLVVDDNCDAADAMAMVLETAGYAVTVEYDPHLALKRAQADPPDVCLLDIGLPGMDGNELARRLRANALTAPATMIALTGYGRQFDKQTSFDAGFEHYFVKPVSMLKLVDLLDEIKTMRLFNEPSQHSQSGT